MKVSEWFNLGLAVKQGGASWIHGPLFNYAGDPTVTFTGLRSIVQQQGLQFNVGVQPINDPFEFQNGPPIVADSTTQLEGSILQILQREFAPFNILVQSAAAANIGQVRNTLALNNPLKDPNSHNDDVTKYDVTKDRGANFNPADLAIDPVTGLATKYAYQDAYIFVGGFTRGGLVADQLSILATSENGPTGSLLQSETAFFPFPGTADFGNFSEFPDPGVAPLPPAMGMATPQELPYADGGGAVCADKIIQLARQGRLNPNIGIATNVAQMGASIWGITQLSDGLASTSNPFFDGDIQLLTSSDVMREGPQDAFITPTTTNLELYPTLTDVSFFSRFPQMVGLGNQDPNLTQNTYDLMVNDPDIGAATVLTFDPVTLTFIPHPVAYVTGTGAWDRVSITADPMDPTLADVTVDAFRDGTFDPSMQLGTFSYTIDLTAGSIFVELGRRDDQLIIDPTLTSPSGFGLTVQVFGGSDTDSMIVNDSSGSLSLDVTPTNVRAVDFNINTLRFDTTFVLSNGMTIQANEFDDNTIEHVEGFLNLDYHMQRFLGDNYTVTTDDLGNMLIDGTAGPTPFQLVLGVANVEFTNIPNVLIEAAIGKTNDSVVINATNGLALGLQNFEVDLGPGNDSLLMQGTFDATFVYDGGAGIDTIGTIGDGDWTLSDAALTSSAGGSVQLINLIGENANMTGGAGNNTFAIESWSGTANLEGLEGNDTFVIGNAASTVTGTLNVFGGDDNDTFQVNAWSGLGSLNGDAGNDTFNIGDPANLANPVTGLFSSFGGDGNDLFHINTWSTGGTISGDAGKDNFIVGVGGDIDTVTGHLILVGGDGSDTLTLDDSSTAEAANYFITASSVFDDPSTPHAFGGIDFDLTLDNIILSGTQGNNSFFVTPNIKTTIRINGMSPPFGVVPPDGDVLVVDFTGTKGAKRSNNFAPPGPGNGAWTFTSGQKPIVFTSIERLQQAPTPFLAAGANIGKGSKPLVKVYDASSNALVFTFYAFEQTFTGGVRVAVADVNGDGIQDIIVGSGAGRVAEVKVYDGAALVALAPATGQHLVANPAAALLADFKPEAPTYRGGLFVGAGDVDGDGQADIVTSRSSGATMVRVFHGPAFTQVLAFAPYLPKEKVTTGASLAVGDVDGDGRADIVTAPGAGHVVSVKVFDGASGLLQHQFQAFETAFKNGASLAVGDTDGDGQGEIMVGTGAGGKSRVRVFDDFGNMRREFKAYTTGNINAPVQLATHSINGQLVLFTAQSNDGRSREIHGFDPLSGKLVDNFLENDPAFISGVYLG